MTTQEIHSLYEELEAILVRKFPPERYGEDSDLASICTIAQELRDDLLKQKELNAEWIDVNERLPEENGLYLIHKTPDPDRMVEYLIDVIFYCKEKPFNRFVTHWMEIPKRLNLSLKNPKSHETPCPLHTSNTLRGS